MADTIRGDFSDTPCSDCGEKGGVYLKHWGPLVPPGTVAYMDEKCYLRRRDDSIAGRAPVPLGHPLPKFYLEAAERAEREDKTVREVLDEDRERLRGTPFPEGE